MDIRDYNRTAWTRESAKQNIWTVPVTPEAIQAAREGDWSIVLTPTLPVPRDWFPPLQGLKILCLASGGGQQGPILAAAGADVTVFDNCPSQLDADRMVAERDGLKIQTVEGDMKDLGCFSNGEFDLIVHPVSNVFVPDVLPVWREAFRVLRKGGSLLAGFMNPAVYLFDWELAESTGELRVAYSLPYADTTHLPESILNKRIECSEPMEFSHTLDEQIGGPLAAGFFIAGFFEDREPADDINPLPRYMATCMAIRAVKP
ncbi:class I SAM-dependent methyltransferase [Dehalogenimonas sp. THU2]|uniref:class I SAM-dependent methyltransferase n=1 Tax=Dehalogenimonas sp. THU2 TaxID=3151121 RepID=UPI00321889E2